jgi:hypothetical protein
MEKATRQSDTARPASHAAILDTDGNGGRRLLEIRFSGKKFFFQIEPQSASTTCADPPLLIPECESELPW